MTGPLVLMGFLACYHTANLHGFYPIAPDALSITDRKGRLVPHVYLTPCPGAASNASNYKTVTNQAPSLGQHSYRSEPHIKYARNLLRCNPWPWIQGPPVHYSAAGTSYKRQEADSNDCAESF